MNYDLDSAKLHVGPGWHPLLDILFAAKPKGVTVTQVKEKFGGLRFYVDAAPDGYFGLICDVGKLSYMVCEDCGRLGKLRLGGWWRTLCDECEEKS